MSESPALVSQSTNKTKPKSPTPSVPSAPDLELISLGLINSGLAIRLDELLAIGPGFTRFLRLEQRRPQLTVRAFREKPGS